MQVRKVIGAGDCYDNGRFQGPQGPVAVSLLGCVLARTLHPPTHPTPLLATSVLGARGGER